MNKDNTKLKMVILVLSIIMLIAANIYFIHFYAKATASCYGLFSGPYVKTSGNVDMVLNLSNTMQTTAGKVTLLLIFLVIPLLISIIFIVQKKNISIPAFINSAVALLLILTIIIGGMILNSACENLKNSLDIHHDNSGGRMAIPESVSPSTAGSASGLISLSSSIPELTSSGISTEGSFSPAFCS